MKKFVFNIFCCFTLIAIMSGGPAPEDLKRNPEMVPYSKLLRYANHLSPRPRALVDTFIKYDQVINVRASYYTMMTRHSK